MREHLVNDLSKVKLITIYLGNECNFDCKYCDRGYIKSIGTQVISRRTGDDMAQFFEWANEQPNIIERVSFHGGEPLLFINRMETIMQWLYPMAKANNWIITMTTNGSLVKQNEWFFEKYSDVLYATVSYDFMYQGLNREEFDVIEMADVLNKYCKSWQWQFVIPIDDPKSFSFNNISEIVNTCNKTNQRMINIIPLRHKRGKDKFDVIIDRIPLKVFLGAFLEFLQILYIKKITCFIDGCYIDIDKAYFGDHHKLILSPDGYIYPEFEFLEYRIDDARIGSWKEKKVWFGKGDEGMIPESCLGCEKRASCGLKYLYHMFDEQPNGSCKEFYTYMDYAIMHNAKLNEKRSVLEWVGIKEDFAINE
jgi:MoaA/NifB/PqqE/SkfB family radical SAM enzyme